MAFSQASALGLRRAQKVRGIAMFAIHNKLWIDIFNSSRVSDDVEAITDYQVPELCSDSELSRFPVHPQRFLSQQSWQVVERQRKIMLETQSAREKSLQSSPADLHKSSCKRNVEKRRGKRQLDKGLYVVWERILVLFMKKMGDLRAQLLHLPSNIFYKVRHEPWLLGTCSWCATSNWRKNLLLKERSIVAKIKKHNHWRSKQNIFSLRHYPVNVKESCNTVMNTDIAYYLAYKERKKDVYVWSRLANFCGLKLKHENDDLQKPILKNSIS